MAKDEVRLRPLRPEDEAAARAAHEALKADDFEFLLMFDPEQPWASLLSLHDRLRRGVDMPEGKVPATFLGAFVDGTLVGRVDIRHEMNDWLARYGGHIGYGVIPEARRRGYAREVLRQALIVARSLGVDDVLLTCDDTNVASARTIEANGGELESVIPGPDGGEKRRRYWIR